MMDTKINKYPVTWVVKIYCGKLFKERKGDVCVQHRISFHSFFWSFHLLSQQTFKDCVLNTKFSGRCWRYRRGLKLKGIGKYVVLKYWGIHASFKKLIKTMATADKHILETCSCLEGDHLTPWDQWSLPSDFLISSFVRCLHFVSQPKVCLTFIMGLTVFSKS